MVDEIWKDVIDWEDRYEVSNLGRVRSKTYIKYICTTGTPIPYFTQPRIISTKICKKGYVAISLHKDKRSLFTRVHVLVCKAFLGLPNGDNYQVNHKNFIKDDNNVDNLEWVTASENILHSYDNGNRSNKGEEHSQAYILESDVVNIRDLYSKGYNCRSIARTLGIPYHNTYSIATNRSWKHI